jgi:hypothetical protein
MRSTHKKRIYIFIDESGTLPDTRDKYFILSAVTTREQRDLVEIANKLRKSSSKKHKVMSEIKYYKASDNIKTKYLTELSNLEIKAYVLEINKSNKKVQDSPLNYSIAANKLINKIMKSFNKSEIEITFDRHFHNERSQNEFNEYIFRKDPRIAKIRHVDSQRERAVNSADMVSGSYLARITKRSNFFRIISKKVKVYKTSWVKLKRENLAEPV